MYSSRHHTKYGGLVTQTSKVSLFVPINRQVATKLCLCVPMLIAVLVAIGYDSAT